MSDRTIHIANIDYGLVAQDIRDVCAQYGPIEEIYYPHRPSGMHMGFAYCTYVSAENANKAYEKLHLRHVKGREWRVTWAQQSPAAFKRPRDPDTGTVLATEQFLASLDAPSVVTEPPLKKTRTDVLPPPPLKTRVDQALGTLQTLTLDEMDTLHPVVRAQLMCLREVIKLLTPTH